MIKINYGKILTFLKKASVVLEYLTKKKPVPPPIEDKIPGGPIG